MLNLNRAVNCRTMSPDERPAGRGTALIALFAVASGVTILGLVALVLSRAVPQATADDPRVSLAVNAAGAALRARLALPGDVMQRGVQVFSQALPDSYAVCGRVVEAGTLGGAVVPYVAMIAFDGAVARVTDFVLGMTGAEATRTFVEMVDRCFEGGGPPNARLLARPLPPLPHSTTRVDDYVPPSIPNIAAVGRGSIRTVITTSSHGANIRRSPQATEILRVAPRATRLEVYDEAPGGWLQVGQGAVVWGWVHNSVLDPMSR